MNNAAELFPTMLGVKEAASSTGLPVNFIRTLIREGRIRYVQAGSKKFFVNADSLRAYLEQGDGGATV